MKNEKFFEETGTKRDRLAFLRGLVTVTALAAALVFGFAACDNGSGGGEDASARYVGTYTLKRRPYSATVEDTFEVKADLTFTFTAGDTGAVRASTTAGVWSVTGDYITLASVDWGEYEEVFARLDADNNLEVTDWIAGDPLWGDSKTYTRQVTRFAWPLGFAKRPGFPARRDSGEAGDRHRAVG